MRVFQRKTGENSFFASFIAVIAVVGMAMAFSMGNAHAATVNQKQFGSPEDAVKALIAAVKANDTKELLAILGPTAKILIFSGDEIADQAGRERFAKAYDEMNQLERKDENRVILHVGSEDWPFPLPIVKKGTSWYFNTSEGKDEILNRRIGRNELNAIQVCLAIVDAEREYASQDRTGAGILQYAQKFMSKPGRKDGLYWAAKDGEEPSPLGPLAAKASDEGYRSKEPGDQPVPYHGYFYRILKAQGKHAPGGARDYLVNGKMIGGFAVVAYPAEYSNSGIMTFIVNQDGAVYEKNLGGKTAQIAKGLKAFDPDETWQRVQ